MRAMIFAAGMGTRLKPLTNEIPKALVPVAGKPMLEHTIISLIKAGCTEIVINVYHFAQQIIDFVKSKDSFGIAIYFSDESKYLLDTGGGLKNAAKFFSGNDPIILHNVDILSNVDLKAFYDQHILNKSVATLLVSNRKTSRYLIFDKKKLCGWRNYETGEVKSYYPRFEPERYNEYAFSGIHIVSPKIFELMEIWTGKFSIMQFYLFISAKSTINSYVVDNLKLIDIGKIHAIEEAEASFSDFQHA